MLRNDDVRTRSITDELVGVCDEAGPQAQTEHRLAVGVLDVEVGLEPAGRFRLASIHSLFST